LVIIRRIIGSVENLLQMMLLKTCLVSRLLSQRKQNTSASKAGGGLSTHGSIFSLNTLGTVKHPAAVVFADGDRLSIDGSVDYSEAGLVRNSLATA
jgi:hypothetical protein